MDTVDYVRRAGSNVLKFSKRIAHYGSQRQDAALGYSLPSADGKAIDADDFGEDL